MAYHPSTPTRASRYVPVTPPSVSTAPVPYTTGYTTDYNAPTSHGGWNAQSPPTDYATPIYSYTEHVAPYSVPISPTTSYLAPENSEFVADQRGRHNHANEPVNPSTGSFGYGSPQSTHLRGEFHRHGAYGASSEDHSSLWSRSKRILERDQNARNLFVSAFVLGLYSFIQLGWGLIVESHSLFAVSFWSLYMSINLGVAFLMQSISKQKPTDSYPFGFGRVEIVAVFTNGSLLLFAGLYVSFEAIEGLVEPVHTHEHFFQLILAVIGIILHSIIATVFPEALAPRTETSSALYTSIYTSSAQLKLTSLVSHLCGPVAILIVALSGSSFTDATIALIFSVYLYWVSIPLCWRSGRVLLQAVPQSLQDLIERSLFDISRIPGVVSLNFEKTHVWTISPGVHVGTITLEAEPGVDDDSIIKTAISILKPYVYHLTVQITQKHEEHYHHSHEHDHDHDHHHDHDHDHDHNHNHSHDHHSHSHDHSHGHEHSHYSNS